MSNVVLSTIPEKTQKHCTYNWMNKTLNHVVIMHCIQNKRSERGTTATTEPARKVANETGHKYKGARIHVRLATTAEPPEHAQSVVIGSLKGWKCPTVGVGVL